MEEDRISALPDCLLMKILSHQPSTEEAVRTGTLSKRWEHLWNLVPTLIFEHDNDNHSQSDFVSLVDETLAEGRQLLLKKFEFTYARHPRYSVKPESNVNHWSRYALTCNVPEVNILNPTEAISWKNLKSLYIHNAELDEALIGHILIGSPVLETLVLDDFYGFGLLNISKSVKKLVYSAYMNPQSFDVCAPFISSLTIKGDLYLSRPLLADVSSLVEANIDYTSDETMPKEIEERRFKILLETLKHVKEVKIGASFSKVVSRLEAKGFVFPANVKFVANG